MKIESFPILGKRLQKKKQEPSNSLPNNQNSLDNQNFSKELATEKEMDELLLKLGSNGLDFSEIFANEPWLTSENKRITTKKIPAQESKNGVLGACQKKPHAHVKKHSLMSKLHEVLDDNPQARTAGKVLRIFKETLAKEGLLNPFKDDQIRNYLYSLESRIDKDPYQQRCRINRNSTFSPKV